MKIYIYSFTNKINEIVDLLSNSDLPLTQIAQITGKGIATIRRINKGETHYNKNLSYPLRK